MAGNRAPQDRSTDRRCSFPNVPRRLPVILTTEEVARDRRGEETSPPLMSDLLKYWTVVVRFGDRFERAYPRGDSNTTLLVEFESV